MEALTCNTCEDPHKHPGRIMQGFHVCFLNNLNESGTEFPWLELLEVENIWSLLTGVC